MRTEYTAVVEKDRGWFVVHCVEFPGASGRGPTLESAKRSLAEAIVLILERRERESLGEEGDTGEPPVLH